MSSAALHASPALTSTPLSPPAGRTSSQSTPSHDHTYHAAHTTSGSPSRRPSSRKQSAGAQPVPITRNQTASSTASSTTQALPSTAAPHASSPPTFDRIANMAPIAPPRSSSNQQGSYSGERRSYETSRRGASNAEANGAPEANRHSKRAITSQATPNETGRTRSRDGRTADPTQSQPKPPRATRDAHDTLNRIVSDPENVNRGSHQDQQNGAAAVSPIVNTGDDRRNGRSRNDYSKTHKGTSRFGNFILGNTIGEGEFGKVKLGWRPESNVQVAIKLIKRDTVGSNPSRMAKIHREVTILRGVRHPNIVRLIDMVETDRYIGIILEYASGGELFDYILNHRYLKDHAARRLFSQLVSGVGYLHKKGIVHRDLKLENLLLDRNRNIIITDFGFANTFDSNEELSDEEELNLSDKDFVKRMGLDKVKPNGTRRGDLMQTSCGSPCYAAPELVVSDSLYTGRKVDVWSCGVILYAMLAGYLPFDDDPANPEGDNINLLYKYIVTTPLTFPEYVTPHARDLLRRILVPNPRKRADLFEVARHSWLSEYAHAVEFITSSTTLPSDVKDTPAPAVLEDFGDAPGLGRSSSVRESSKPKSPQQASVGGLAKAHGKIDREPETRTPKDAKRRTVQVEYVAPTTQTQRGSDAGYQISPTSRHRDNQDKPLPQDPPQTWDHYTRSRDSSRPASTSRPGATPRVVAGARAATENAYPTRPLTGGSMQSSQSMGLHNYGQLAPPEIADTNAQGRIQQPENEQIGRPSTSLPPKFARLSGIQGPAQGGHGKGHKRSNTIGEISAKFLGRNGSVFGRSKKRIEQPEKPTKRYPPVSMANAMPSAGAVGGGMGGGEEYASRPSMDSRHSRRSFSLGIGKKRSGSLTGSQASGEKAERRRFSLLPASFSLKAIGLGKDDDSAPPSDLGSQPSLQEGRYDQQQQRSATAHGGDGRNPNNFFDNLEHRGSSSSPAHQQHQRHVSAQVEGSRRPSALPQHLHNKQPLPGSMSADVSSPHMRRPPTEPRVGSHQHSMSTSHSEFWDAQRGGPSRGNRSTVLQKNHKRFTDAYDQDDYRGHEGSSGAAKRVMDFFRRRGKARGGEDR